MIWLIFLHICSFNECGQWTWVGNLSIIHIKSCMRIDILKWRGKKTQARGKSWNNLSSFVFTLDPVWECEKHVWDIHSKSEQIGGVYFSGQQNWRKKCVNGNGIFLRQIYVTHEHACNSNSIIAYLLTNMIFVCVYLIF